MADLVAPTVEVHASFLAAMAEFRAEGRTGDNSMIGHDLQEYSATWGTPEGFAAYVTALRADALQETPRPAAHVPSTTLWWVEGHDYLGRVSIRHRLTPTLLEYGGHIGYDVRASARRRGHATAMLRAALPLARRLGIETALITCEVDNIGSRTVIELNGGVLEDERNGKLRFWAPTDESGTRL
jgi:predicted acetyltransferase